MKKVFLSFIFSLLFPISAGAQVMGIQPAGGTPGGAYTANAVDSDGSNDNLTTTSLTGTANDAQGILSVWLRDDGGSGNRLIYDDSNGANGIKIQSGETFLFDMDNASGTTVMSLASTSSTTNGVWHHLLVSWDVAAGTCHLYFDGSEDSAGGTCSSSTVVDWTTTTHTIGDHYLNILKWNGCIAEFYLNMAEFLDFSVSGNRDLFRDGDGKPPFLETDGSGPTGNAPLLYFNNGGSAWGTNKGIGSNFTITGAFDDCSNSPSD